MESALYCLAVVMDVTYLNGTDIPYWTVHCSITLNGACYHGLFYWLSLPKSPLLAGASYSPRGICLVTRGYRRENQNQNTLILLVSLNNAGESPLFMVVDARASEIMTTILPKSNPYSPLHRSSDGQTILHRANLRADLSKILSPFLFLFCLF